MILQRELLNLEIPFATCALFIFLFLFYFFLVLIIDLAIPYSAFRSPTLFPLSRLEIFFLSWCLIQLAFSLYFAGSWLKLCSSIIKKNIFTAKGTNKQITELN